MEVSNLSAGDDRMKSQARRAKLVLLPALVLWALACGGSGGISDGPTEPTTNAITGTMPLSVSDFVLTGGGNCTMLRIGSYEFTAQPPGSEPGTSIAESTIVLLGLGLECISPPHSFNVSNIGIGGVRSRGDSVYFNLLGLKARGVFSAQVGAWVGILSGVMPFSPSGTTDSLTARFQLGRGNVR